MADEEGLCAGITDIVTFLGPLYRHHINSGLVVFVLEAAYWPAAAAQARSTGSWVRLSIVAWEASHPSVRLTRVGNPLEILAGGLFGGVPSTAVPKMSCPSGKPTGCMREVQPSDESQARGGFQNTVWRV